MHRIRMEREAIAKVVASVWGGRIYAIPCRASCLALVDLEEKVEFILFFQINKRGKEFNKFCPLNRHDDLCLCFCLHPSSMMQCVYCTLVSLLLFPLPASPSAPPASPFFFFGPIFESFKSKYFHLYKLVFPTDMFAFVEVKSWALSSR